MTDQTSTPSAATGPAKPAAQLVSPEGIARAEAFRTAARPIFGLVSGSPTTVLRIAARNKTQHKAIAQLATEHGGSARVLGSSSTYPALVLIEFR